MSPSTRILGCVLSASLLTQLSACGTLFYPDRRGQIEGHVDPVIVVLDAIGILFYVLPGLIALGVDFATGAIYLPGGKTAQVDPQDLKNLVDSQGQVDRAKLKALIMQKTGKNLPLDNPRVIEHRGDLQQLAAYGLRPAA